MGETYPDYIRRKPQIPISPDIFPRQKVAENEIGNNSVKRNVKVDIVEIELKTNQYLENDETNKDWLCFKSKTLKEILRISYKGISSKLQKCEDLHRNVKSPR